MFENSLLAYVIGLLFSSGAGAMVTLLVKGRKEASKVGAEAANIERKTGPEVDSIAVGTASAALEMQLKVNAALFAENARLNVTVAAQREQIVTLETKQQSLIERLDAAEFSLRSARLEAQAFEDELRIIRESDFDNPPKG